MKDDDVCPLDKDQLGMYTIGFSYLSQVKSTYNKLVELCFFFGVYVIICNQLK